MDQDSVFQKTTRGFLESSGNTRTLPGNMLALLKEIDGQRTVKELQSKVGSIYNAARTLQVLKGFVEDNLIRELVGAEKPEPTREAPRKAPPRAAEPEKPVQPPQEPAASAENAKPPAQVTRAPSPAEPDPGDAELAKAKVLAAAERTARAQKEAETLARARAEAKEAETRTGIDDDLDFTKTTK
ncbi:MAG: hypothetical protein NT123_08410 [Proteobacteria bacterium]|nr:hypothetical protein [Pseudomonadota bacterium]